MRGGNLEDALVAARHAPGNLREVFGFEQHTADDLDRFLAGLRQPQEAFAAAHKQLDAELVLEILDVLAHTRLGSEQCARHLG